MSEARLASTEDFTRHAITLPHGAVLPESVTDMFAKANRSRREMQILPQSLTVDLDLSKIEAQVGCELRKHVMQTLTEAMVADVTRKVVAAVRCGLSGEDAGVTPLEHFGYDWRMETARLKRVEQAYREVVAACKPADEADSPVIVAAGKNVFDGKESG